MYPAQATGREDRNPRLVGEIGGGGDGGAARLAADQGGGQVADAALHGPVITAEPLQFDSAQADHGLAVEHPDSGRYGAGGPDHVLGLAGDLHIPRPGQAMGDDGRLERDDRAVVSQRSLNMVTDPERHGGQHS